MLKDPQFSDKILDKHEYAEMLESRGNIINEYAAHWVVEINSHKDLEYYMDYDLRDRQLERDETLCR